MINLTGQNYFAAIIVAMRQAGFKFITQVQISDKDLPYHVRAKSARSTTLFFKIPMRQFVVQMVFTESVQEKLAGKEELHDHLQQYWSLHIHKQFKDCSEIYKILGSKHRGDLEPGHMFHTDEKWEQFEKEIPMYKTTEEDLIEGFRYCGDGKFEQNDPSKWEDPKNLADKIFELWSGMADYIGEFGRFGKYQVTSFPPHYVFPECEYLFWYLFGQDNLHKLVKHAWGSEFPPTFNTNKRKYAIA